MTELTVSTEKECTDDWAALQLNGMNLIRNIKHREYLVLEILRYPIGIQLDQLYHDMKDGKLGVAATTGSWFVVITRSRLLSQDINNQSISMAHLRSTNYEIQQGHDAITLDPNGGAVLLGVTTVTSVKVGAAVTISESGIEQRRWNHLCNINGTQMVVEEI